MWRQVVAAVVQMCGACDLARQSFNRPHATLSPLSIRGLLYRWSIDLCGPFSLTRQLKSYCMVLVEGHCRWAEMVAIPGKESAIIARVFLERVVGCYGCCGGGEFRGAFDALLPSLFIDHRTTSANHPQANRLAERAVQTLKRAVNIAQALGDCQGGQCVGHGSTVHHAGVQFLGPGLHGPVSL